MTHKMEYDNFKQYEQKKKKKSSKSLRYYTQLQK